MELEKAISTFARRPIKVIFSGRTDSGVHAQGQIAHFDIDNYDADLWRLVSADDPQKRMPCAVNRPRPAALTRNQALHILRSLPDQRRNA